MTLLNMYDELMQIINEKDIINIIYLDPYRDYNRLFKWKNVKDTFKAINYNNKTQRDIINHRILIRCKKFDLIRKKYIVNQWTVHERIENINCFSCDKKLSIQWVIPLGELSDEDFLLTYDHYSHKECDKDCLFYTVFGCLLIENNTGALYHRHCLLQKCPLNKGDVE